MSEPHVCELLPPACLCNSAHLEPAEDCPIHNGGEWPPRCYLCGRFMPWPKVEEESRDE